MIPTRLRFMFDTRLTVSGIADKALRYRRDTEIFRTDENLSRYDLACSGITVARFVATSNRLSNLLAGLGVARFDRVAVWKANSLDIFLIGYATMRLGGIAVPINGGMEPSDLMAFLANVGARVLCTDRAGVRRLHAAGLVCPDTLDTILLVDDAEPATPDAIGRIAIVRLADIWAEAGESFAPPRMADDQDVLICHTSGTTGFPKGVLHCSKSLALAAQGQVRAQPVSANNLAMSACWVNHHIMMTGCLAALVAGVPLYVATRLDPEHLLATIARERVTIFFSFPDVYLTMIRAGLDRYDLSSMRLWMSGGDAMHEVHIRAFCGQGAFLRIAGRRVIGSAFCELLGTSEVGMVALMKTSFSGTRQFARCVGRRTLISPRVKVADAAGVPRSSGAVGRLMVKGPTVFKGYWNDHARIHGAVVDGWWWTGDLAYRDRAGRFYHVDREVDAVRTRDGVIYGLPVEEEALKFPGVHEAVLFGGIDRHGDELPMLLIQQVSGMRVDADAIRAFVERRVALARPIARVVLVDNDADVPRGLTGKVLKRRLRQLYAADAA